MRFGWIAGVSVVLGTALAAQAAEIAIKAAITKQLVNVGADDKVTAELELVTVVAPHHRMRPLRVEGPKGLAVQRFEERVDAARCNEKQCKQRFALSLAPGAGVCRLDGTYHARFQVKGDGKQTVTFKLASENFCGTTTVTVPQEQAPAPTPTPPPPTTTPVITVPSERDGGAGELQSFWSLAVSGATFAAARKIADAVAQTARAEAAKK